jgi:hypothetical protein
MVSVLGTLLERKARRRKESAGAPRGRRRGAGEERPRALAGGDQGRGFEARDGIAFSTFSILVQSNKRFDLT